jgi:hypothetical protein
MSGVTCIDKPTVSLDKINFAAWICGNWAI